MMNKATLMALVPIILFFYSCSGDNQPISITDRPVFSEKDSFVTSVGNTVITKYDYFLVKGRLPDKGKLKKMIIDFTDKYSDEDKMHYNNYLMFFYKNSDEVNEEVIKSEEEKYRYKIFDRTKDDDYIGCINYWDSTKFFEWYGRYE